MAEGEAKLSGPDLAHGIPSQSLADGQMLVGHAHGKAVLLVRTGAEIFAVAPHCSHYNGPLAEGLIVRPDSALPIASRLLICRPERQFARRHSVRSPVGM